jgi:DNA-binding XRE family transcriptional regulator
MNEELMSYYRARLADNLPTLRAKLKMTQEELADRLNISRHTVIGIESKNRVMPWTTFLAIVFLFERFEETKLLLHVLKIYPVEYEDELHSNFEVV